MNRKILLKYIFIYTPMIIGVILFSFRIINIFSSLLLFVGGYIAIKNTFDYRMVRKNVKSVSISNKSNSVYTRDRESVNIRKRKKRNIRVRKREKY